MSNSAKTWSCMMLLAGLLIGRGLAGTPGGFTVGAVCLLLASMGWFVWQQVKVCP